MGLFDKKYCDFCGEKIGLLGNRKLEDGNMCKKCAAKLSPWFSERRHSTKSDIQAQLEYRERNLEQVAAFNATKTFGKRTKFMIDENAKKFLVTSATNLQSANPDVLDYSQAKGCELDIQESRNEIKQKDANGNSVSYNPPRYEYSYCFRVKILVDSPYFDDMDFELSDGYITTGEQPMNPSMQPSGWNVTGSSSDYDTKAYYECVKTGNEIKAAIENMRNSASAEPKQEPTPAPQSAPSSGPVTCPSCGATTTPDPSGCCEYCGSKL
ncbi:MAG: DUF4428 domain-containing protein [Treponema sp.]|nr:DUF4428 domain-containing protein [Treponema sp.]MBQ2080590.1 DUF4428 domain-containing protein [Treponema sp.]